MTEKSELRKVGALWKPKPGAKSHGSGSVTIGDQRQRFVILTNRDKGTNANAPDYVLMSSEAPEVDPYSQKRQNSPVEAERTVSRPVAGAKSPEIDDDSIPF